MKQAKSTPKAYFVGIGGIGMSALARYFKALKWSVSGSDAVRSSITNSLDKEGIKVKIGQKRGNISPGPTFITYNRAISDNNPELAAARASGMPTVPYAEILGAITREFFTVAITGSHGKSTTTALAGLTLMKGGLDPTILIGTNLKELGGKNMRFGKSPYLVLEADDFGAAFLEYSPTVAIVTNIDREHMDFYKTFGKVKSSFIKFLSKTRTGGAWILNRDDKPLFSLRAKINILAKKNSTRVIWYSLNDPSAKKIARAMALPGGHNRSNAAAAYALGKLLNINEKKILTAIGSYRGAWRRMEYKGTEKLGARTVRIYDDYAHHPTEIKATLNAFREKFPHSPLICIFQPHQAKRLAALFGEFQTAFREADIAIILPLYKVKGRDERTAKSSEALARVMQRKFPQKYIFYAESEKKMKAMAKKIVQELPSDPIIIMMGAGDIIDISNRGIMGA